MTAGSEPGREPGQAPALVVVRGNPSDEQIAAVVAVLSVRARSGGVARRGEPGRSEWSARHRLLREPLARAPGGWRASALPR
jgi:Acyl-CoA carboxylase epsilon subunit